MIGAAEAVGEATQLSHDVAPGAAMIAQAVSQMTTHMAAAEVAEVARTKAAEAPEVGASLSIDAAQTKKDRAVQAAVLPAVAPQ
jgi:hypothetical protein